MTFKEEKLKSFDKAFGGKEVVSEAWYTDCKDFISQTIDETAERAMKGFVKFVHTDIHFPEEVDFAQQVKCKAKEFIEEFKK